VVPPIFEYADDSHFGLTLLSVNRTHLTVTLRNSGSNGEEGEGPLGRVLDSYTLRAKEPQGQQQQQQQQQEGGVRREMEEM
jgi:hypothetical protein